MQGWLVFIGSSVIDTVFYDDDCDADYVYSSLVNHDGYPVEITVAKCKSRLSL